MKVPRITIPFDSREAGRNFWRKLPTPNTFRSYAPAKAEASKRRRILVLPRQSDNTKCGAAGVGVGVGGRGSRVEGRGSGVGGLGSGRVSRSISAVLTLYPVPGIRYPVLGTTVLFRGDS